MNWKKLILPPVAIYAVVFLAVAILSGTGDVPGIGLLAVVGLFTFIYIVPVVGLFLATLYAKPKNIKEGFIYGVVWFLILLALDLIVTRQFTGGAFIYDWKTWIVYALVILVPTLLSKK